MREIYELLFGDQDIYEDFDTKDGWMLDLQGWGGHREYFKARIEETEPHLIIEVGTWKGKSACAMADICTEIFETDRHPSDPQPTMPEIVCVDTWLGATEFWTNHQDPKRYKSLALACGYPQVYYQFLANVILSGHENIITPFPQSSINAARLFRKQGVEADLIYVDASHEYDDVKMDLEYYYDCLRSGGVMFGDDYCEYWKGVIQAVDEFAASKGLHVQTERYLNPDGQAPSDYWRIRKP